MQWSSRGVLREGALSLRSEERAALDRPQGPVGEGERHPYHQVGGDRAEHDLGVHGASQD
jgi:hypothetical protein